jgi:tetrahydromethanopterin S-methyltransferase subunit A
MEESFENWPPAEGRYKIGNRKSPVAVCTNASVAGFGLDMKKIAIQGKAVTENIGIEKIIQNVVSNPYIRFLIICGKVSKGHFVGQAILSLKKNGIDDEKRIIGAKGNTPFLKGIDKEAIERFRKQIEVVDLMGEKNPEIIMKAVDDCFKRNPGMFTGKAMKIEKIEEIKATAVSKWIPDPKGFFVISINPHKKKIIVEYFQNNKLTKKIVGDSAEDISKTIADLDLIGDFEQSLGHAMYLGRELQKAELALKNDLNYEQDSPLRIEKERSNKDNKDKKEPVDENDWFD